MSVGPKQWICKRCFALRLAAPRSGMFDEEADFTCQTRDASSTIRVNVKDIPSISCVRSDRVIYTSTSALLQEHYAACTRSQTTCSKYYSPLRETNITNRSISNQKKTKNQQARLQSHKLNDDVFQPRQMHTMATPAPKPTAMRSKWSKSSSGSL